MRGRLSQDAGNPTKIMVYNRAMNEMPTRQERLLTVLRLGNKKRAGKPASKTEEKLIYLLDQEIAYEAQGLMYRHIGKEVQNPTYYAMKWEAVKKAAQDAKDHTSFGHEPEDVEKEWIYEDYLPLSRVWQTGEDNLLRFKNGSLFLWGMLF